MSPPTESHSDRPSQATVLVVDDEPSIREMLSIVLRREGHRVLLADAGKAAVDLLRREPVDILVSDIRMPDMNGVDLLREAKRIDPQVIGIMITAFASTESAVEALRLGAHDYLSKPFDVDELKAKVREALEHRRLKEENAALKKALAHAGDFANIVGESPAIQELKERIRRVAPTPSTVLITGESGTGKELVARAVHAYSTRRSAPFVAVNCGALPETLLESELFGHVRGAFTGAESNKKGLFEVAEHGTMVVLQLQGCDVRMDHLWQAPYRVPHHAQRQSVQIAPVRTRPHPPVRSVVPAVCLKLSRSRGHDARAGPVCRPYDDLSMGAALCARDRQTVSAIPEAHQRLVSDRRDVRACRRGLDVSLPWRRFQRRYPGFLAASDARQEGGHRVLPQDVRRGSYDAPSRGDRGQEPRLPGRVRGRPTRGTRPTAFESSPMQVSEQHHRAGPPIHQTPHPADAGLQAIHHGVADLARHRDHACAPQGTGAMDGEGRRGRADAADPQGVRIGRVTRSTQRILARDPKPCNRTTWSAVHVYFGDERCVAADDVRSNYHMVESALLSHVAVPPTQVHRIHCELAPDAAAADYAARLGAVPLDVVLLGMGQDGHTASLFSGTPLTDIPPVLATKSPAAPTDRVSLGLGPINGAGVVVLLVAGEAKAQRLADVHHQITTGRPVFPAAHVQPASGRLLWLIDAEAARRLSPADFSRTYPDPLGGTEHHGR